MVGWLATQYQRLAAKAERDGQYATACGCLNSLRVMLVQPQLDRQFEAHFRGRHAPGTPPITTVQLGSTQNRDAAISLLTARAGFDWLG